MISQIQLGLDPSKRNCQKTEELVVPQLLEWSSHSLAYEVTQLAKTSHTTFPGHHTHPLPWPTYFGVCFSLNLNKSTFHLSLCLSLNFFFFFFFFFAMRHQEPGLHQVLKPVTMGFGQAQVLGERSWRMGGKGSGQNVPRNPLHNLSENLRNTWSVLTVFIGLILVTKKIKDRGSPTPLGNSY